MASLLTDLPRTLVALALVAVLGGLYSRGVANARRAGLEGSLGHLRIAAFASGLAALLVALSGPLEAAGNSHLVAIAVQQQLLTLVAAPLLLLGMARWAFTLALPVGLRRWALAEAWDSRLARTAREWLFGPVPVLIGFCLGTTIWYAPPILEARLGSPALRAVAQVVMLGAALLFWSQVIPSRPQRLRLGYVLRTLYLGAAGLWSSMIGGLFMFTVAPFYQHYVALAGVGVANALVDQHLAGAALDVPGVSVFFLGMAALIYLWLREDERQGAALSGDAPGGAARVS